MRIFSEQLRGRVDIPPSKSISHRAVICAALAQGTSKVDNIILSEDILATIEALRALGLAEIQCTPTVEGRYCLTIEGCINSVGRLQSPKPVLVDCAESGSTLRFMIPIAAALGLPTEFVGRGRLGQRPLQVYYELFDQQGVAYSTQANALPLCVTGRLRAGSFELPGDVSSQFITGLLLALPLLQGDSSIIITTALESVGYIDLTLQTLADFGIKVAHDNYRRFYIPGNQQYRPGNYTVEGDYSQAAFWLVAACLGNNISCYGLNKNSRQGDRAILEIIKDMGGTVIWQPDGSVTCAAARTVGTVVDVADCPDIAPIITVLAALSDGETQLVNAARLRIKESDRITSITTELNKLGANVTELADGIKVRGVLALRACDSLDAWNDHRIAMALAVACSRADGISVLRGADSVKKSYPGFWQDYKALGGHIGEEWT